MKKILLTFVGALALMTACTKDDFLDPRTTGLTDDQVFSDSTRTLAFMSRIYADQGFSFNKGRWQTHGNTEQMTDDAEYLYIGTDKPSIQFYLGILTPVTYMGDGSSFSASNASDFWYTPWTNIRRCNLLLSRLPGAPLSAQKKARMVAETRFLRAWYIEQLITQFGGVPLIGNTLYTAEDIINIPRNSYADCVDYVITELDFCATQLPDVNGIPKAGASGYSSVEYGRVTSGTALALKSRLLLRAASPLFNGGAETTDGSLAALVSYPTNDQSRWQRAANAAKAVIDLNQYSLAVDNTTKPGYGFYNLFLQRVNSEYIYANERPANKDFEAHYYPGTRGGARNTTPTQEIVNAFPMANGKAITDATSGYSASNPYVNRDPRFRYSIIFNGAGVYSSLGSVQPVYTYNGPGATADAISLSGPSTGYFFRKMCDSTTAANSGANTTRSWPLIRYAEILLNYAEALNELGQTEPALQQIFALRQRAGIQPGTGNRYGIAVGLSQADARTLIRNERRIELLNEEQRLIDLRRWKLAMTVLNQANTRMNVVNTGTATARTFTYNVVPVVARPRHSFRPEMYLLPFPDAEIRKVPLLRQNPGW
jgi:hypothetical protein